MLDRLYLPILGLVAAAAIALSLVWPQGLGARSPGPFGHTPALQTPAMQAAIHRENEAAQRRLAEAHEATLQGQQAAPAR
jgi:hypothetical protein